MKVHVSCLKLLASSRSAINGLGESFRWFSPPVALAKLPKQPRVQARFARGALLRCHRAILLGDGGLANVCGVASDFEMVTPKVFLLVHVKLGGDLARISFEVIRAVGVASIVVV